MTGVPPTADAAAGAPAGAAVSRGPAGEPAAIDADAAIDERAFSKLRWRCRRGLLENDLLIERFFNRHAATLSERQAGGLLELMDLSDNDLLDLLLGRIVPVGAELGADAVQVLRLMREPA